MSTILTNFRTRQASPVAVAAFVALTLAACGGHNNPPPAPTVTISVSPATITVGQSATLTWSSTNAVSCAASGNGWTGNQQLMGTMAETPTTTGAVTFTLTCTGAGGGGGGYGGGGSAAQTATQTATLTVNAPPPTAFVMKALVADGAGVAATQDTHLVNAWGLVFAPNDPVWTANNKTDTSTLYDGNGAIEPSAAQPLVVTLPKALDGTAFQATGIVAFTPSAQNTTEFSVTAGGKTGQALFIYSGLGGQLAGWAPNVSLTQAVSAYTATDKACYRGLAIANNGTANFLYANDFVGAKIDVFDGTWTKQSTTNFPFADPNLPANYAPFNIQAIPNGPGGATQLYVSYAKSGTGCEDTRGAGFGAINVFDTNGKLVTELVKTGGALNAPWGMAWAPKDFGTLSLALLVANHADGMINAYDPAKGTWIGALQTSAGAFVQPGLWGIAFGNEGVLNGTNLNQPHNTLFFTAGPNEAANGLYGRIDLPPAM